jgi:hypothetical protein
MRKITFRSKADSNNIELDYFGGGGVQIQSAQNRVKRWTYVVMMITMMVNFHVP